MPNISDKLREFFGDPTIPGQAVEEVLINAKAMGYHAVKGDEPSGGGYTVFEFTYIGDGVLESVDDMSTIGEAGLTQPIMFHLPKVVDDANGYMLGETSLLVLYTAKAISSGTGVPYKFINYVYNDTIGSAYINEITIAHGKVLITFYKPD